MRFTDPKAIELLDKADNDYLYDRINEVSNLEDEGYEGYSDLKILYEEAEYVWTVYTDSDCRMFQEVREARKLIRETQDGKSFPIKDLANFREELEEGYRAVQRARAVITEYDRLKGVVQTLRKMRL